jgi:hypothetical protein
MLRLASNSVKPPFCQIRGVLPCVRRSTWLASASLPIHSELAVLRASFLGNSLRPEALSTVARLSSSAQVTPTVGISRQRSVDVRPLDLLETVVAKRLVVMMVVAEDLTLRNLSDELRHRVRVPAGNVERLRSRVDVIELKVVSPATHNTAATEHLERPVGERGVSALVRIPHDLWARGGLARPRGLEPPTCRSGIYCCIHSTTGACRRRCRHRHP